MPVFLLGLFVVISTVQAAIRSFVLPRSESVRINKWALALVRYLFDTVAALGKTYAQRDRVMALYAPVGLITIPLVCLALVAAGYTAMYWALGRGDVATCFRLSNNVLLTLGTSNPPKSLLISTLSYSEAALGLLLITLLISYIPTMYQAFSERESVVAQLELRAGTNRSATDLVCWLERADEPSDNDTEWNTWAQWFLALEEQQTSLPMLTFFRSPQPGRSWVTAADIILDAAALMMSAVERKPSRYQDLCFRAGCLSLNRIMRYFRDQSNTHTASWIKGEQPVTPPDQESYRKSLVRLREVGIPIVADEDAAWRAYVQLRTHYREAVEYLARLTISPDLHALEVEQTENK
ncbi:hypothetical protein MUN82_16795 [Hymenobacter aerilatus]|uniref:Uncharacterized protein n=1 Tax=Hymenobacter aerilatus TaxID=2932251 RepID=A0A8T9SV44_9BACT|nr:hypothetical protein [Hymenobacter aerilatus]UOR04593.1 hypothetical protein MUN82_16795 [Hymenobacter aerilatus]